MNSFKTAQSIIVRGLVFLLPLFFLPITSEFYDFNKGYLLLFGSLLGLLLWALSKTRGEFRIRITPFDLPVLVFALLFVIAGLTVTPNKYSAFVFPGTASWVVIGTLFYFLINQYFEGQEERKSSVLSLSSLLLLGSGIAAVIALLSGTGVLAALTGSVAGIPTWLKQPSFNTIGGVLPAATLFATLIPLSLGGLMKGDGEKQTKSTHTIVGVLSFVLLMAGLGVMIFNGFPGKATSIQLMPISSSWAIALETFKQEPLLGVGPGNFIEAFNRFRPVEFNASNVWNLRFTVASNWYLQVWTEAGILGLLAFLWVVLKVVSFVKKIKLSFVHYSLIAALVLLAFVPANFVLLVVLYLLLAMVASPLGSDISLSFAARDENAHRTNLLPGILALICLVSIIAAGYRGGRVYAAEMSYKKALDGVVANDARVTYDALVSAINLNPFIDRYRTDFSRVNLAIANNLSAKKDITDAEKQTVSQLVQQSIREGQAAASLNSTNAANWENLAGIYQAIIPLAEGADQYTVAAYNQAITYDPINPLLRLALGGVLYSLGQYDEAVRTLEYAVAAKGDYANAHYNLAVALKAKGNTARAAQEMQAVLNLVTAGTQDYELAKKELDELTKKLTEEQAKEATQSAQTSQTQLGQPVQADQEPLTNPSPAPSPAPNQISLPSDAAPTTSPSPSPSL